MSAAQAVNMYSNAVLIYPYAHSAPHDKSCHQWPLNRGLQQQRRLQCAHSAQVEASVPVLLCYHKPAESRQMCEPCNPSICNVNTQACIGVNPHKLQGPSAPAPVTWSCPRLSKALHLGPDRGGTCLEWRVCRSWPTLSWMSSTCAAAAPRLTAAHRTALRWVHRSCATSAPAGTLLAWGGGTAARHTQGREMQRHLWR